MPGSTRAPFASEDFQGKSANGPYGDSVEELDWSTGEIMRTLQEQGLDERTLVIWTSDNGAPRRNPPQGSNAPLKGWGYDISEGAMRMPCLVRWPGVIPADSTCGELCTAMDLFPTFARLAGVETPSDRVIDGRDTLPLLTADAAAESPHEAFFYYFGGQLQAVRTNSPTWKLYLPLEKKVGARGRNQGPSEAELYNLDDDLGETRNVAAEHPDVVARLLALAEKARKDLGDEGIEGTGQRPAGWVDNPTGRVP